MVLSTEVRSQQQVLPVYSEFYSVCDSMHVPVSTQYHQPNIAPASLSLASYTHVLLGRLRGSRFERWYAWICFLVLCLCFLLRVRLDLATVSSSCTYVRVWCGFIVEPGVMLGWKRLVLWTECFCISIRVRSCRMVVSDSFSEGSHPASFRTCFVTTSNAIYAISAAIRFTRPLKLTL